MTFFDYCFYYEQNVSDPLSLITCMKEFMYKNVSYPLSLCICCVVVLLCCLFLLRPHQIAATVVKTTKFPTTDATIGVTKILFFFFKFILLQETGAIRSWFPHTLHPLMSLSTKNCLWYINCNSYKSIHRLFLCGNLYIIFIERIFFPKMIK